MISRPFSWFHGNRDQAIPGIGTEASIPKTVPSPRNASSQSDSISNSPSDTSQRRLDNVPTRIHFYGLGAIGKLVAHSLRGIADPPPITLIAHRRRLLDEWMESKKVLTVEQDGYRLPASGFDMELALPSKRFFGVEVDDPDILYQNAEEGMKGDQAAELYRQRQKEQQDVNEEQPRELEPDESDEPIYNLILSVKGPRTVSALSALKHRLRPESTICILQNGMGFVDDIKKHVFPEATSRPNIILGIVSHGANTPPGSGPFFAVHAGHGTIALGVMPRDDGTGNDVPAAFFPPTARYLMRTLTRTPVLAATGLPPAEFLQQQLEKLSMNAVVNPLTAMMDSRNGSLLYNFHITRTMRLLIAEISLVIRSLPELQGIPNVSTRFSAERIEMLAVSIANKTKNNISSMLTDVRRGNVTEIQYINGYIVKRGEEVGVQCVCNYMIMQMVKGKYAMIKRELLNEVPLAEVDESTGERGDVAPASAEKDDEEENV